MEQRIEIGQKNCFVFRGSSSQDDPGIGRQRSPGLSLGGMVSLSGFDIAARLWPFPWQAKNTGSKKNAPVGWSERAWRDPRGGRAAGIWLDRARVRGRWKWRWSDRGEDCGYCDVVEAVCRAEMTVTLPWVDILAGTVWMMASPNECNTTELCWLCWAWLQDPGNSGRAPPQTVGDEKRVEQRGGGQNAVKELDGGVGKGREGGG